MQEQIRTVRPQLAPAGGGLGGMFGDDSMFAPTVTVSHGIHQETARAGQTVGEIRRRLRDRLSLPDNTPAFVNGQQVGDETRVQQGATLTFMRKGGEKGLAA